MILVAGGTGHLGRELVPLLQTRGTPVRVLTRDPDGARQKLGADVAFVFGDAKDAARLPEAMSGVETVISALTGFGIRGQGVLAVDYEANVSLMRAAESASVKRFVLVSMHGAAPDHPMQLLRMKYCAEQALRASSLQWTIVRPTVFAELWAAIIGNPIVNSGKATIFGRGDNPINFVSVRDLARMIVELLLDRNAPPVIEFGGAENLSLNEVVTRIAAATGRKGKVRRIPLTVLRCSRVLLRPFRADLAGFVEAGISMGSSDMRFDAAQVRKRLPNLELTSMTEVIERNFGHPAMHAATRGGRLHERTH